MCPAITAPGMAVTACEMPGSQNSRPAHEIVGRRGPQDPAGRDVERMHAGHRRSIVRLAVVAVEHVGDRGVEARAVGCHAEVHAALYSAATDARRPDLAPAALRIEGEDPARLLPGEQQVPTWPRQQDHGARRSPRRVRLPSGSSGGPGTCRPHSMHRPTSSEPARRAHRRGGERRGWRRCCRPRAIE